MVKTLRPCLTALVLVAAVFSHAQFSPLPGKIEGQNMVGSAGPEGFVATPRNIYARNQGYPNPGTYTPVWTAPVGTYIYSIEYSKIGSDYYYVVGVTGYNTEYFQLLNPLYRGGGTYGGLRSVYSPYLYALGKIGGGLYLKDLNSMLYHSTDTGQTWQIDTLGFGFANDFATDSSGNVFVTNNIAGYRKNAGSNTWQMLAYEPRYSRLFIDRHNRILNGGGVYGYLYMSTDNGNSWNDFTAGLNPHVNPKLFADDVQGNLYMSGDALPYSIVHSSRLYFSAGGTQPWEERDTGIYTLCDNNMVFFQSITGDSFITVTSTAGIFTSADQGNTWVRNNRGLHSEYLYSIAKQANGRLVAGTYNGLYYLDPGDTVWTQSFLNGGADVVQAPNGDLYSPNKAGYPAHVDYPWLLKSTDNGSTWFLDTVGLSQFNMGQFYIDETGAQHYYTGEGAAGNEIWTRVPNGNWVLDTLGLPTADTINQSVISAVISDKRGFLYAQLHQNGINWYRRPVAGGVWQLDTMTNGNTFFWETYFPISDSLHGIFAEGSNFFYQRDSSGWHFKQTPNGWSIYNRWSISASGTIYTAFTNNVTNGEEGVYSSSDGGSNWSYVGLMDTDVAKLFSFGLSTYAITGTYWCYVLEEPGDTLNTGINHISSSADIKVYPNPSANGCWTVTSSAQWTGATLQIIDLNGKICGKAVVTGPDIKVANPYLPSGTYLFHFTGTNGRQQTIRVIKAG